MNDIRPLTLYVHLKVYISGLRVIPGVCEYILRSMEKKKKDFVVSTEYSGSGVGITTEYRSYGYSMWGRWGHCRLCVI
jgi:hypothetical protein